MEYGRRLMTRIHRLVTSRVRSEYESFRVSASIYMYITFRGVSTLTRLGKPQCPPLPQLYCQFRGVQRETHDTSSQLIAHRNHTRKNVAYDDADDASLDRRIINIAVNLQP